MGSILCSQCNCSMLNNESLKYKCTCTWEITGQRRVMFSKIVNINHTTTKFATIVPYTCVIMRTNFGKKQTTFAEVTLKHRMDPSSQTPAWLPSVLNLRCLWALYIGLNIWLWLQLWLRTILRGLEISRDGAEERWTELSWKDALLDVQTWTGWTKVLHQGTYSEALPLQTRYYTNLALCRKYHTRTHKTSYDTCELPRTVRILSLS